MNPCPDQADRDPAPPDAVEESTGLALLPSWFHVYVFVGAWFLICVALLAALTIFFS